MKKEPIVEVGILTAERINFHISGKFFVNGKPYNQGDYDVETRHGMLIWHRRSYKYLRFEPQDEQSTFTIYDVTIGKNFHWQQKENQTFKGVLEFIPHGKLVTALNLVGAETYITGVVAAEMSADAPRELIKAHAVISRSWLMNLLEGKRKFPKDAKETTPRESENERQVWYNHRQHSHFQVCADDHCQRYQGIKDERQSLRVEPIVRETRGEVLMYGSEICDARFSKCCGGVTEEYQNCWEPIEYPYLKSRRDIRMKADVPDLTNERNARKWLTTRPDACCNVSDRSLLNEALNSYDRKTTDFFRWYKHYTTEQLTQIFQKKTGVDVGEITALEPLERGTSGRITRMRVVGTKRNFIIGKELEIRKALSDTHLYSSAFVVDKKENGFLLTGGGWGHGVGLCQIGAAFMAKQGCSYYEILVHYYRNAVIKLNYL